MIFIDAQIHSWYSDRPGRPWDPRYRATFRDKPSYLQHAGQTNSPDMVLREMVEVGVQGALLTPVMVYGDSIDLELDAAEEHPDKFQVIGVVDHLSNKLAEHLERSKSRGLRGLRMLEMREPERVARGEFDHALALCAELGLVVTLSLAHPLNPQLVELLRRHSDVFFYIDHLGTGFAPPILGFRPEKPFEHLAAVLETAELPNVGLKMTGAPALSQEAFPFRDIWSPVRQLVGAFGADRVSWGTDYTRCAPLHSYWEGKNYLAEIPGFSDEQLELMYGETLVQRLDWRPTE